MTLDEKIDLLTRAELPESIVDVYDEDEISLTLCNGDIYYFYDMEEKIKFLRLVFSNELYLIQEHIVKNAISKDLEKYIDREKYITDKVNEHINDFKKFQEAVFVNEINGVEIYKKKAPDMIDAIKLVLDGGTSPIITDDGYNKYTYNDETYIVLTNETILEECKSLAKHILYKDLYDVKHTYLYDVIMNDDHILDKYANDILEDFENYMDYVHIDSFKHDGKWYEIFKYNQYE